MEIQSLALGVIITALSALIILWPLVSQRADEGDGRALSSQMESLVIQRDAIYSTIRDLDFDYETGKVTADDYRAQRESWVVRGIAVLKAMDALAAEGGVFPAPGASLTPRKPKPGASASSSVPTDLNERIEAAVEARRRTT